VNGGKVFRVAAEVERTVLSIVSSIEDPPVVVQFVCDGGAVNFHAGGEDDEIVPLAHHVEKVVEVGSLVDEKPHRMLVDHHL